MPFEQDLRDSFDGAHNALLRMETIAHEALAGIKPQSEARSLIESELSTLNDYAGNITALLGTVTTPPPYYPAGLICTRLTCVHSIAEQNVPAIHY